MEIRPLTPTDAVAYRAVRLRGLREYPEAFKVGPTYYAKNHMVLDLTAS